MAAIRLIIAEPDASYAKSIASHLGSKRDYEITAVCCSGTELIELALRHKPDAVILNAVLQGIDGLSALRRLRDMTSSTAFIVCTEFYNECCIRRAQRYGARCFLCKPVMMDILDECIKESVSESYEAVPQISSKDSIISEKLSGLGIPKHCEGYELLRQAVRLVCADPEIVSSMTKRLYPAVARIAGSTVSRVERNIRSVIAAAHKRGMHSDRSKPTNREFILGITEELRNMQI